MWATVRRLKVGRRGPGSGQVVLVLVPVCIRYLKEVTGGQCSSSVVTETRLEKNDPQLLQFNSRDV